MVEVLVRNAGTLVTQRQLLASGSQYETETNYLRFYRASIRSERAPAPTGTGLVRPARLAWGILLLA
jgi:hypothetical protein